MNPNHHIKQGRTMQRAWWVFLKHKRRTEVQYLADGSLIYRGRPDSRIGGNYDYEYIEER